MPRRLTELCAALADEGLDLVRVFDAHAYNRVADEHASLSPLPTFGREHALALLIGNSRALWPRFIAALSGSAALRTHPNPLDTHVTEVVTRLLDAGELPYEVRFTHVGGAELVSMLHAAEASGLARVGPAHLAVHERFGPWFGLRALAVFDAPPPSVPLPPTQTPCEGCEAPCKPVFQRALESGSSPGGQGWRVWLAVRDSCPVAPSSRYGEDQILYHYTKARSALGVTE